MVVEEVSLKEERKTDGLVMGLGTRLVGSLAPSMPRCNNTSTFVLVSPTSRPSLSHLRTPSNHQTSPWTEMLRAEDRLAGFVVMSDASVNLPLPPSSKTLASSHPVSQKKPCRASPQAQSAAKK